MSSSPGVGRHRGAGSRARSGPRRWAICYVGERPGWLVHVAMCTLVTGQAVVQPGDWWSWPLSALGLALLVSAVGFRYELDAAEEWGTGVPVPVTFARYLWLQAFKVPFYLMLLASLVWWVWSHLTS